MKVGSTRGIETMFRNAYRAQLDLIALAAMKANIMISINGFIASVLVVSGAFILATDPLFIPPTVVFLSTATVSIYFAIRAADPGASKSKPSLQDFADEKANILIFEDCAKLPKEEYLERMRALMTDRKQIYRSMADRLYWFGTMADRKFKMLRYSYTVFRWGIIISLLMLLVVLLYARFLPTSSMFQDTAGRAGVGRQLESIFEPSAKKADEEATGNISVSSAVQKYGSFK